MAAIFFQRARQTFMTRCRSVGDVWASSKEIKPFGLPVLLSIAKKCSGCTVFGSTSPKTGSSHFQARTQSSRFSWSAVHAIPFCLSLGFA